MELKDVFEYMGFEKEPENIDEFKEVVKNNWTLKKEASKDDSIRNEVMGSTFKNSGQTMRKWFNENFSLEIPNSELDNKKLEDFVFSAVGKIKEKYEGQVSEYQKKITEPNTIIEEQAHKLTTFEKSLKAERDAKKAIEEHFNSYKEQKESEVKKVKLDYLKQDITSKIKFSKDVVSTKMGEMALKGYHKDMEDKYVIDFDEAGEPIILDKNKGERIPNEKVAGKYKTPQEIFEEEAILANLVATNEHAEKPKEKISTFVNSGSVEPKSDYANRVFFGAPKQ